MAVDPISQGIRRGAFVFGFLKAWKQNRKEKRAARKGKGMAINLGTRTSTNSGVAGIVAIVIIKALSVVAPDFAPPEGFEAGITAVVMYVIARFSKSPAEPKAL